MIYFVMECEFQFSWILKGYVRIKEQFNNIILTQKQLVEYFSTPFVTWKDQKFPYWEQF